MTTVVGKNLPTGPAGISTSLVLMAIGAIPPEESVQPTTACVPRMDTCFIPMGKVLTPTVPVVDTFGVFVLQTTHSRTPTTASVPSPPGGTTASPGGICPMPDGIAQAPGGIAPVSILETKQDTGIASPPDRTRTLSIGRYTVSSRETLPPVGASGTAAGIAPSLIGGRVRLRRTHLSPALVSRSLALRTGVKWNTKGPS